MRWNATWIHKADHTWLAAAGGTSIGHKGMINAAKTLAMTAADLFQGPDPVKKAREEWNEVGARTSTPILSLRPDSIVRLQKI